MFMSMSTCALKQLHYIWTFDDLYSAFAVKGLRREQGRLWHKALAQVAAEMIVARPLKSGPASCMAYGFFLKRFDPIENQH